MRIRLRFTGADAVPEKVMAAVLDGINENLTKLEIQSIKTIRIEFPEVPLVAVDAALFRADHFKSGSVTRIQAVKPGSVEVVIGVVALSYWLLEKTVGETIKDAWTQSGLHRRLKRFLLLGQEERLNQAVEDTFAKSKKLSQLRESVRMRTLRKNDSDPDAPMLEVEVEIVQTQEGPPTYADLADEYNDGK
jgi:hypothetical protein